MMFRYTNILLVLYFTITSLYSQHTVTDSLENILEKKESKDESYIDILNQIALAYQPTDVEKSLKYALIADSLSDKLGYTIGKAESNRLTGVYYIRNSNYSLAYQYISKALELFKEENNLLGIINCKNSLGAIYSYLGNFDKALEAFNKSLIACEHSDETDLMTLAYNNIGNIYYFQGKYNKAIESYKKALFIREEAGEKAGLAASYNNIGAVYQVQGDYPKALEYFHKTKEYSRELGNMRTLAMSLNNIGAIYYTQEEYEKALDFYQQALEIRKKLDDKKGIATVYNNIGGIYKSKKDYDNALMYYQKSLEIVKETGDITDMPHSYYSIANVSLAMKEYDNAFEYYNKAYELSKEIGLKSKKAWCIIGLAKVYLAQGKYQPAYELSKRSYRIASEIGGVKLLQQSSEILSKSAAKIGLFEEAYNFHVIYKNISDSIRSEENIRKIIGLEYEFEYKKEKELSRLEQEKREAVFKEELLHQKNIRNTFILGFIFSVLLLIILTYAFIQRKKKNRLLAIQRSLEFKQNFLANMSHEIRTPLTGLMGMIELLRKTTLNEEQKDYLNTISQSTDNLHEIINQLLDYSKIETGNVKLNRRVTKFRNLFDNAKKLFESISDKNVELEINVDDSIPEYIVADKSRLKQVINNLILNSVKYTSKGKVSLKANLVKVDNTSSELFIRVEVSDTGLGIKKDKFDQIFTPFGQIDESDTRSFDGTGLGLAICKELVKLHGGEMGFESEYKVGSTFWFTFMAKNVSKDKTDENSNYNEELLGNKKLNILFVEDKVATQKVVSLQLTSFGHSVTIADNGEHAIELYKPGLFDLILMDIQMPVMDGVAATKKLKEEYTDLPPIVGLSANAFEGAREKYMSLGMDEFLTKPLINEQFFEVVKKVLK